MVVMKMKMKTSVRMRGARKLDQVSAHDAGDGAAGAHHGDRGIRARRSPAPAPPRLRRADKTTGISQCPSRSSILSPKIHRNHMLPSTCIQPPCRNMEVKTVAQPELVRDQPVVFDQGIARVGAQRGFEQEDQQVDGDQRNGHHRPRIAGLRIFEWEHLGGRGRASDAGLHLRMRAARRALHQRADLVERRRFRRARPSPCS